MLWTDASGATTAALVGDFEQAAARAPTAEEALRQLKELLEWRLENEPWNVDPDLTEPELIEVKVDVRPQYREKRRLIPCPETVGLRLPCVAGLQENGLRLCALPHLGLRFNYQDAASLKGLVAHYVNEHFQGFSPLRLASHLPPRECRLEEIVLRAGTSRERQLPPENRPELKILFTVADPLLHDLGRKKGSSAAYGRDSLSLALTHKLGREKANVLLVGESGVGKSTLLLDAVKRLAREKNVARENEDPEANAGMRAYRFWRGSAGRMIAGMRYLGQWEERCEAFIKRLENVDGVWCVENLLELVQVGGEGPGDSVAAFVLPYLQRGELRIVSEATPSEVEACRRLFPGLLDLFQIIQVPAFKDPEAIQVLHRIAEAQAATGRLQLEPGISDLTHRLFKRFLPYAALPGPAAGFIRALFDRRSTRDSTRVSSIGLREVIELFIQRTGLPEIFLRDDLPLHGQEVRERFDRQIIGQPDATAAAARLITTMKAGLSDPGRPPGVLLFCGPTGVGKTALARGLAEFCFGAAGEKDRLVRLDMSEYGGWGASTRFLQDPQRNPAPWIERVRQRPFCVLLFDEIEKAAPEVFDVLLGLLDEGRLTDRFGRVTYFRSAIVILTSNLGATDPAAAGFSTETSPAYEPAVAKFFRPEFFNRLDAVVTFQPLGPAEVKRIAEKELSELTAREGFTSAELTIAWSEAVVSALARAGYDHRFGARPLQRALERLVAMPLARWKVAHPDARKLKLHLELNAAGEVEVQVNTR